MNGEQLDHDTIRACIKALGFPEISGAEYSDAIHRDQHRRDVAKLEALLPADKPKQLVKEWIDKTGMSSMSSLAPQVESYTRWLLSSGYLKESEG